MADLRIEKDKVLFNCDMSSLFTNVPVDEAVLITIRSEIHYAVHTVIQYLHFHMAQVSVIIVSKLRPTNYTLSPFWVVGS